MSMGENSKVTARHLQRKAYLYIRQSTVRQVFENTESTKRQYDLRQRAIALGWPHDDIVVIDSDLGQSGASKDREGFQSLVTEVGMGRAGIVLGLEVSRLARNSSDWHRLLEICALTDTLILDEEGIYDPSHFNDRLLLGLKGTMSEAELHVMRSRLRGGLLNKVRRGELVCRLPVGLVKDANGRVVLDPDKQVQDSIRLLFHTYLRTGTAHATAKYFHEQHLLFPRRLNGGPQHGEIVWGLLSLNRVVATLHNPRYAGTFAFGRYRWRKKPDGRMTHEIVPREQWHTVVVGAHPGYITWPEYELIQQRLRETARAYGADRRHGPPREGPALLQGLLVCGSCGTRMTLRYRHRGGRLLPDYYCNRRGMAHAEPICTCVPGAAIDAAVSELLLGAMSPVAIETALAVDQEIHTKLLQTDRLRKQQVDRAQYEADLARRRYMQVDPDNRLVADSLEAEWNHKLRALADAKETYERERELDRTERGPVERDRLLRLATDFPAVFRDANTPDRERKRMIRLLLEDVTILRGEQVTLHVRFRGGESTTLTLPAPRLPWELRATDKGVIAEIDQLLAQHTCSEVAAVLNQRGRTTGAGAPFSAASVQWIIFSAKLKSLKERLRDAGMLTAPELAQKLGVCVDTVRTWRRQGRLQARMCDDRGEWLYHPPSDHGIIQDPPKPTTGKKRVKRSPPGSTVGGAV
jgi:DNA invertase Pin-like site-specific DNA recombinase